MQRIRVERIAALDATGARTPFVADPRVSLDGMRILATGGLGALASSFALSAARAGAEVVLVDLLPTDMKAAAEDSRASHLAAEFADAGCEIPAFYSADVTDPLDTWELFERVSHEAGAPDVVVNFAGTHHRPFDLAAVRDGAALAALAAEFERVCRVNLNGAFHVTAAAASVMVARRDGQIIHLCSNGSRASLYGSYAYNASKHGVEGLVKSAAAQLAAFNVRVNGVAPGTVVTGLNRELMFDEAGEPRARARSILAHTPTKRFASPDGVAQTILAMCAPQRHATGNVVFCDDGYNVEGHSWPEGNAALYEGEAALERLYAGLEQEYPRERRTQ